MTVGGIAAASALGLVLPVAQLVGDIISNKKDKVLQALSGSLFLDEERKAEDELSDTVIAPDNNMEVDVDALLFDAASDEDTTADTKQAETNLKAAGLLFAEGDG